MSNSTYLRKWQVLVSAESSSQDSNTAFDVSNLRCCFDISMQVTTPTNRCVLQIYNLSPSTEGEILKSGYNLKIMAGYQESRYGLIFDGDIIQVFRDRQNGTDYVINILAISGNKIFGENRIRSSIAAGSNPRQIIDKIASDADETFSVGQVSDNLSKQVLPRGKILFGDVNEYIRNISIQEDSYYWEDEESVFTMQKSDDEVPSGSAVEIGPDNGLIGVPVYSDDGIHIPMLLDSRVKPMGLVKIDNSLIQRQIANIDLTSPGLISPQTDKFDIDGEYQVFSLTHSGDTHGDLWRTDVVGFSRTKDVIQIQKSKEDITK